MSDTTIKKTDQAHSPTGPLGQKYLVAGKNVSMRLWENEQPGERKRKTAREYETVGYVLSGRAKLTTEGQAIILEPGDSWVVPKGALHSYEILEPFSAVESTSPPAEFYVRDDQPPEPLS